MLTTKNRVGIGQTGVLIVSVTVWLLGCTPAGPRALLEGERRLHEGQIESAVSSLERAVRLIPDNPQAWNHLGLAYHRAGRFDQAAQAYQQALTLSNALAPARFNLGCLDLERGDNEGAIRELSAFLASEPNSPDGWLRLGTAQLRARRTEAAERSFQQAVQLDARSPEGLNGLGLVQVQRRSYPEAYRQFQAATQLQPDYAPALRNAAIVAHQHLKNRSVALQRYRELVALPNLPDKDSVELLITRLEDELKPAPKLPAQPPQVAEAPTPPDRRGDQGEVAESSSRAGLPPTPLARAETTGPAVTNPPIAPRPVTNAAPRPKMVANTNQSRPPVATPPAQPVREPEAPARRPAVKVLERTVTNAEPAIDASSPFPRYRYRALGTPRKGDRTAAERAFAEGYRAHTRYRFSEAVSAYQRAIQSDPSFFEAQYNLGVAAYESGDLPLALSAYETALAIEQDSLKARYNFASTLEQAGYPRDAADEFEKLAPRHDDEVRLHAALANLYAHKLGDPKRARTHYLRVLELDPRYPDATAIRYWLERNP